MCSGCGSDVISCRRASLLTNRTRAPGETTSSAGLAAPAAEMVIRLGLSGGAGAAGPELPPPHAATSVRHTIGSARWRRTSEPVAGGDREGPIGHGDGVRLDL